MKSFSIHNKLLLIYTATTLLVFSIAGAYWVYSNYQFHERYFTERITSQGTIVASNIGAAVLFDDDRAAADVLSALASESAVVEAQVLALDGTLLYVQQFSSGGLANASNSLSTPQEKLENLSLDIVEADQRIAELRLIYHERELRKAIMQSTFITVLMALLAVGLGAIFAARFHHIVTKPILHLSGVARKVADEKDYSLRSQVFYPDEVGALSEIFNDMLGNLGQRDRDLEKRFEQAFYNAPIAMALIDEQGMIIRCNDVVYKLFDAQSLKDKPIGEMITPEQRGPVYDKFFQMVSGNLSRFDTSVSCVSSLREGLQVVMHISAVYDEAGNFNYAVLQCQDVTESLRLSQELEYQASHDALTGLANRRVLNQALSEVSADKRGTEKKHTLCVLDLDQFKTVNDTCGHLAGDRLLCQVADTIRERVRKGDLVVRLGGDEFALILYNCDRETAKSLCESIRKGIEAILFEWEGNTFRISVSIGAMSSTLANADTSLALQKVDSACFAAKESGRNRVNLIESGDASIKERRGEMRWIHDLHQAMKQDRFVIFAQPIFPISNETASEHVEILLRLSQPDGRLIPPGAFLPAAERYGLSVKLDQWVVQNLLENLPRYRQAFGDKRSYWVNLSGASISDAQFLSDLEATIKAADLPANMLNFEITETSIIRNLSVARDAIVRLKALGCQFSLDDFGSGMSSFGYLKHLPVDYIKIDGMFIRDMLEDKVNMAFVKSIIDIANVMNIGTIAEYVESPEILEKVIELGASFAQGYALGRPEELLSEALADHVGISAVER